MDRKINDLKKFIIDDVNRVNDSFKKEFPKKDLTRDYFRKHKSHRLKESEWTDLFGSFDNLKVQAGIESDEDNVYRDHLDIRIDDSDSEYPRRYFVTAAIAGGALNNKFFNSIKTYCRENNAKLVILPMRGVRLHEDCFDEEILLYQGSFSTEYTFSTKLRAIDFMISPQMINPLTGLNRFGQKSHSLLIAAPKQFMKTVPVSKEKLPHMIYSTGTITLPHYLSTRQGKLAEQDHCFGGLVVEIESKEVFHIRPVQATETNGFYDLDKYYEDNKVLKAKSSAFVLGDIHTGFQDETAICAWKECVALLNPTYVVIHDIFDGHSISHHHQKDIERQVNRNPDINTLEKELNKVGEFLVDWNKSFPDTKILIVRSNHDEFLDRYLKEGRYVDDRFNHKLALRLASWYLDGFNPLQKYIEENFSVKNIQWLRRDKDYKLFGIQIGAHGDKGANGGRSSVTSLELSYNNSITGHSHSPSIIRNAWVVGTSSKLQMDYNIGSPSSWVHASAVIYPKGYKSLIISIDGKWRL